jgi:hypothetical protein
MGFTSTDDWVSEVTQNGKFWRTDWNKITGGSALTANRFFDMSMLAGTPIANTYAGTALTATQAIAPTATWPIYVGPDVSPDTKHLTNAAGFTGVATGVPSVIMFVDVLMYYPGISINSATSQALTNSLSLPRYTDGAGVRAFFVTQTASGATAHNISISYTNQSGTAGRTMPVTVSCTASAIATHISHTGSAANNYGPFLPLAAGDTGIRSVQSIQFSAASGSGTGALVLCRPLGNVAPVTLGVISERDFFNQLPSLPRIYDGACIAPLLFTGAATAASSNFYGYLDVSWG